MRKISQSLGTAAAPLVALSFFALILAGPYLVFYVFPLQAYRFTEIVAALSVLASIVFLLLAVAKPMRPAAAVVLLVSSYIVGAFMWVWSVIIVGSLWGIVVLYLVNMFVGVGTIASAFAASLITGHWSVLWQLVVIAAIIVAMRLISAALNPDVRS